MIAAIGCSFIPKAAKETYGLGHFYNASASKTERGLEISVIAVIDVGSKPGYSLSVGQTAAKQALEADKSQQKQESRVDSYIEQLKATKPYLPKQLRYTDRLENYPSLNAESTHAALAFTAERGK